MLKFLRVSKWIYLSSAIILALIFILYLLITPTDGGKTMLLGLIGLLILYWRTERRIKRIANQAHTRPPTSH